MISGHDFLFAILLPAAVSLIILLIGWRPWSRGTPRGEWAGAIAIGVCYCIGLLGLQNMPDLREMSVGEWIRQAVHQLPGLPPASAQDWLFHIGWIVAVLGVIDARVKLPQIVRILVAAVVSVATLCLVLLVKRDGAWATQEPPLWIGCSAAGMVVMFWVFDRASEKIHGPLIPLLLTMAAAGLGMFLMFCSAPTDGQRGLIIAATVGAIVPLAIWSKRLTLVRGGVLAFFALYGGLAAIGYFYPDHVDGKLLLLVAVSPLIGLIPAATKISGWKRLTACLLLAAIPMGFAVGKAGIQFVHEMQAESQEN